MALRNVLHFPDPRLRRKAEPVKEITPVIQTLLDDMLETMYDDNGCGLAATQIGVLDRVVVMDLSHERNQPQFFINPEIIEKSSELVDSKEGCLSVPGGIYDMLKRAAIVQVKFQDREGKFHQIEAEGLLSRCFQHEIDHLNGVLFIDHLSKLKQERIKKKLEKHQRINL